ncbi:MAG: hypothetical protein KDD62_09215, partial [Bdellovibrionales bacterium]|nr:hypothetical protein [Bdellovibrionales bacterium]
MSSFSSFSFNSSVSADRPAKFDVAQDLRGLSFASYGHDRFQWVGECGDIGRSEGSFEPTVSFEVLSDPSGWPPRSCSGVLPDSKGELAAKEVLSEEVSGSEENSRATLLHMNEREVLSSAWVASTAAKSFELPDALMVNAYLPQGFHPGFRFEPTYYEGTRVSVMAALLDRRELLSKFLELIHHLGPVVSVVLESSHQSHCETHVDFMREAIDMPIRHSILLDYEDLLVNDGCTSIAVFNNDQKREVQIDNH